MKKIANLLFSRLFVVALAIALQFGWLYAVIYNISIRFTYANIVLEILSVIVTLVIINNLSNPYYKLAWTFIILLFPVLGISIYLAFGRSKLTKKTRERMDQVNQEMEAYMQVDHKVFAEITAIDKGVANQSRYIYEWAKYPPYRDSETRYYRCGEEMFPDMLRALQAAEKFIFLEYFIIEDGVMFQKILEILKEKVKAGVDVRMIYDDVGCISTLPRKFASEMEQYGIRCVAFNPFRPILSIVMNNRDHRKILVVDGQVAFTGGINIADEYINEVERFGYWKDCGLRLIGEAVWSFSTMFLEMWNYICQTSESYEKFRPDRYVKEPNPADGYTQPYSDTPLDRENVGENIYLNIINHAKDYVYIFTPYLIVDNEMMVALNNAAKCGVDVRIVTPGIPDKRLVYWLTQSYYKALLANGVRIYQYTPGFIHSKCFVCDDKIATVGTVNLDYRSLYLHFECGVFMYQSQAVKEVKEDADAAIECSKEVTMEFCKNRSIIVRAVQSILRLVAPLL